MATMAAAAGRKAIKVIACSSHNLADTARSFSDQLHQFHFSCLALHKNELEVFSGIWESLELQWERPPNYWSPIFLFSRRVWAESRVKWRRFFFQKQDYQLDKATNLLRLLRRETWPLESLRRASWKVQDLLLRATFHLCWLQKPIPQHCQVL